MIIPGRRSDRLSALRPVGIGVVFSPTVCILFCDVLTKEHALLMWECAAVEHNRLKLSAGVSCVSKARRQSKNTRAARKSKTRSAKILHIFLNG